jgi:hypothetical protein
MQARIASVHACTQVTRPAAEGLSLPLDQVQAAEAQTLLAEPGEWYLPTRSQIVDPACRAGDSGHAGARIA